jgi:hypothetical protein
MHTILTIIGAVGGAAFVPLDWGREWQKFPMPPSIGICIGSAAGRLIEMIIFALEKK